MSLLPSLTLTDVRHSYGGHPVLTGVDLAVEPGTVVGLLGANGAGKTTLISIATGLLHADSGSVFVDDIDVSRNRLRAAERVGFAPQHLGVYPTLSTRENLMIFAELSGVRRKALRTRVDEILDALDLGSQAQRTVGELSGGQQRRVHTGMALVSHPRLLFLDEPTVGADIESRRQILATVRELAGRGTAVVYTSHVFSEFEQLEAEIAVLHRGQISARGSIPTLLRNYSQSSVTLTFKTTAPSLHSWQRRDTRTLVRSGQFAPGAALAEVIHELGTHGQTTEDLLDVQLHQPSLEDAFLTLTGTEWSADDNFTDNTDSDGTPASLVGEHR
jgi:ABC-2 type transport system ATP-binding protein